MFAMNAEKPIVYIKPFGGDPVAADYSYTAVQTGLQNTTRVNIVGENGTPEYIIEGRATRPDVRPGKTRNDNDYAKFVLTLSLYDLADGDRLISSKEYECSGSARGFDRAICVAADQMKIRMQDFVDEFFVIRGKIAELDEVNQKKGESDVKSLYINVGYDDGILKGQKFDVIAISEIGGNTAKQIIGEIQVKEVQGSKVSYCKVTKKGKEIGAAISAGKEMIVQSKVDNNLFSILFKH